MKFIEMILKGLGNIAWNFHIYSEARNVHIDEWRLQWTQIYERKVEKNKFEFEIHIFVTAEHLNIHATKTIRFQNILAIYAENFMT